MQLKNIVLGFLLEFIGVILVLYFGNGESSSFSTLKWGGVCLMIGGPFIFWEVLTIREEADH